MTKEELAKKKGIKPKTTPQSPAESLITGGTGTETKVSNNSENIEKKQPPIVAEAKNTKPPKTTSVKDSKGKEDKGLGLNKDGTYRQSNAGRKSIDKSSKKSQITLTLAPDIAEKLKEWASSKRKTAPIYLSDYIEEHFEEIMEYYDKRK